jgi:cytochrome c biogenesis protein CcmG/thiol:disulfide interchange protein DsbE
MAKPINILIVILLLGVVLGAAGCGNDVTSASAPVVGSPAPDFALKTPDGQAVSLGSLRGHPVLLNFWATWCGPCKQEIPFLQDVATDPARLAGGLEMVAVNAKETAQTVRDFQETSGMTYRVLLDPKGQVANLYNIKGIPTTYFIDKDGIIRYVKVGTFSTKNQIEQTLDKTIMKE